MSRSVVFTAAHLGPYQSLVPLEPMLDGGPAVWVVESVAKVHRRARRAPYLDVEALHREYGGAEAFLRALGATVVVRGVSEAVDGTDPESMLASAAEAVGIPLVAVEDFPGNFRRQPGERLDLLFVEDERTRTLHVDRGVHASRVHATGNPRYDALRGVDRAAVRPAARARLGLRAERTVLWVGQPDAEASATTLERLLPELERHGVSLLFRAHPRDDGYRSGRYARLLGSAGLDVLDVGAEQSAVELCCASDLVLTQFSSVAVEASYLGTPSVFVLFDDLGGRYLRTRKGYAVPPWCLAGAAFLVDDGRAVGPVLDLALNDADARSRALLNFSRCYGARRPSANAIATLIERAIGGVDGARAGG